MSKKILVIDDEFGLLEVVQAYLQKEGFDVFTAANGKQGLLLFSEVKPDFIILDLMLPDLSGEDICKSIREVSNVPILMLTAKVHEESRISGFELGADDYLTKPFSPRELVLRVKSIFKRVSGIEKSEHILNYNDGDLRINKDTREVYKKNQLITLTPNEYDILLVLASNSKYVFTRDQIIEQAFGYMFSGYNRTIDSHIKNLRKKIEDNVSEPCYIMTVYGIGYRFGGNNHEAS
ncbi:response regulator transcription factor [Vallitalea okinawensis]|uniref:response regulator transcription factor n=1 Tax=Vallitalea okinawensis TaxID=2078660 RepID=UPI000CFDC599|nr:response regulator transcription factor [Vallitalea okinawensis]